MIFICIFICKIKENKGVFVSFIYFKSILTSETILETNTSVVSGVLKPISIHILKFK